MGEAQGARLDGAGVGLAATLRRLRRSRGLSQRALAAPLHLGAHSTIADYESGRRIPPADVLRSYERFFALRPGELHRLRERALAERAELEAIGAGPAPRPPAATVIPRQLPGVPPHFTGRHEQTQRLDGLLGSDQGSTVAVISGMAGVGKTALATWWAHRHSGRFPDGSLYVNLRGYDPAAEPVDPSVALDGFLRSLGVGGDHLPFRRDDRAALFRSVVADRRLLVLLDNARDAEQVRPLLPGTPTSRTIVTSRSRMTGLLVRDGAADLALDVLAEDEAAELLRLVLRLGPRQGGGALADLAKLCGYLPLALCVAAQHARARVAAGRRGGPGADAWRGAADVVSRAVNETVAGLSDPRTRLDLLNVDDDESSAVRRVLWWSYRSLPAPARRMLRLLGLADGTHIDAAAAAALAGLATTAARGLLESLVATHLLESGRHGYTLHDLVRCFARERVDAEDPAEARLAAIATYTGWLLHSAANARVSLSPHLPPLRVDALTPAVPARRFGTPAAALAWCERELPNLVAAARSAHQAGLYATAWQVPTALYGFFDLRKYFTEWIDSHQVALYAARRLRDRDAEGRILCNLGNAYRPLYRLDEALACYVEALAIFREIGWRQGEAKVLGNLGTTYDDRSEFHEAIAHQLAALGIFEELGDDYGAALTLTNLGASYVEVGQLDDAMRVQQAALARFEQLDDIEGQGRTLGNLGKVLARAGSHEEAIATYERAIVLLRRAGNRIDEGYALADLVSSHHALGADEQAFECGGQAVALFAEIGHDAVRAELLERLATLHRAAGDESAAKRCLADADAAASRITDAQLLAARRAAAPLARAATTAATGDATANAGGVHAATAGASGARPATTRAASRRRGRTT